MQLQLPLHAVLAPDSISASPGRCQRDELRRPSLRDLLPVGRDRPTACDLLPTGSDCGASKAVSQNALDSAVVSPSPRLTRLRFRKHFAYLQIVALNPGFFNIGLKRPDEAPGRFNTYGLGLSMIRQARSLSANDIEALAGLVDGRRAYLIVWPSRFLSTCRLKQASAFPPLKNTCEIFV
jgi:hypothetical protein